MSIKRKPISGFNLPKGIKAFTPTSKRDEEVFVEEELQEEKEESISTSKVASLPEQSLQQSIQANNSEDIVLTGADTVTETKNDQLNVSVIKPPKKSDEKVNWQDAYSKELYLLPNQVVKDLENTVYDLKQVFRKGKISKSKIATIAINKLIAEYKEKGPQSILFKEMYKNT